MKLVIEVNKEDYKRYKEDKVCSYASAVLDAVPLNEVLDEIRAEIENLADSEDSMLTGSWGQGLKDALDIINKHTKGDSE